MNKLLALAFFYLLFAQLDSAVSSPLLEEMLKLLNEHDKRESTKSFPEPSNKVINVPVISKFVTTKVIHLDDGETFILHGDLCGKFQGMAVNVSITLYTNPLWNDNSGVVQFFVVDSKDGKFSETLCTNVKSEKSPYCIVPFWPSSNDIYIKGQVNGGSVSFSLAADLSPQGSGEATYIQQRALANQYKGESLRQFSTTDGDLIELTEVITMSAPQELSYGEDAPLEILLCPKPPGSWYKVRGTVVGTDGKSSFTQCMCNASPCTCDSPNVIGYNDNELPTNELTSYSGPLDKIYVTIKCFSGPYDVTTGEFISKYVYTAQIV